MQNILQQIIKSKNAIGISLEDLNVLEIITLIILIKKNLNIIIKFMKTVSILKLDFVFWSMIRWENIRGIVY